MTDRRDDANAQSIPHSVWPADWLRTAEREAADTLGITLYELMLRAGEAACRLACRVYPEAQHWLILCGHGNNGGDGYVVARLAQSAGRRVTLLAIESDKALPDEAAYARQAWLDAGGEILAADARWPGDIALIIDGLLGTGLTHAPRDNVTALIEKTNCHLAPVLALDIPSGLLATTGAIPGVAIEAAHTLTFITLKPGLLTGKARDVVGKLHHNALGLDAWLASQLPPIARFDAADLSGWLPPRRPTSHKGDNGKLLIIGGDSGTAGAIRMAGEAALRAGAGLVRVLTREENIGPLLTACPELMALALSAETLRQGADWADVIAIGPGLGQTAWGHEALRALAAIDKPMLWDADALNFLAIAPDTRHNRVITPHPGEAARLLQCSVAEVESDRLLSARRLVKQYGGVAILKGAGTVVADEQRLALIDTGNAGMGSGGMGDVLSGITAALLAQKLSLWDAVCAACVAHGAAADRLAACTGTRGMLATDLFSTLYFFVNPELN